MPFQSREEFLAVLSEAQGPDETAIQAANDRNSQLTKPAGSLGRLEEIAQWLAAWQGTDKPKAEKAHIIIFAGNHGVAARGVSAFPPEVTAQMVLNFEHGGAAINQLANISGAHLDVHPIRLDEPTGDFTQTRALDETAFLEALSIGFDAVNQKADVLITGEMGIGNTTAASAICAALTNQDAAAWVGKGTGVDPEGLKRKTQAVEDGLQRHSQAAQSPMDVLAAYGGREMAAMVGAIAAARVRRIPVILDGFICSAAALVLHQLQANFLDHAIAGHASEEPGHIKILEIMDKDPVLNLGMRLGEGSGAAVALRVIQAAAACQSGMATFAEAGVSDA